MSDMRYGYETHREIRLGYADAATHWGLPHYPRDNNRASAIGRVVMMGPEAGFYPLSHPDFSRPTAEAKAREKRQNREKF